MIKLLIFLILLPVNSIAEEQLKILRIIDGDTLLISAPFMPPPLKKQMPMRLSNVDTPNVKRWANCNKEAIQGDKAKAYIEYLVKKSKKQEVKIVGYDKYGRWLGQVFIDGKSISDYLIESKLAKPYYGGKKQSWCN
jgi:endonuclease YncB( thermonuclease family)